MRFIKEHKLISALLIIIVVTLALLISSVASGGRGNFVTEGANTVIKTVTSPFYKAGNKTSSFVSDIGGYKQVIKENEKLKRENQKLKLELKKQKLSQDKLNDLQGLSQALNYIDKNENHKHVTGDITSTDDTLWMHHFSIDIGSKDGVKVGNTVVANGGLVGRVKEVGPNWAKVSSILDQNNNVSFRLSSDSEQLGIINEVKDGKLSGFLINNQATAAIGDKLITSGMGLYPAGIDIGTVTKTNVDKGRQLKIMIVKPSVNFNVLKRVTVII